MRRLRALVEAIVFYRDQPSDPLCVSNRPLARTIGMAAGIGGCCLLVAALLVLILMGAVLRKPSAARREAQAVIADLPVVPVAAQIQRPELEVSEVHVTRGSGATLEGTVRNVSDRAISAADIVCDLADTMGSQLGRVNARVENLAPHSARAFRVAVETRTASLVLVREVRAE
jgi:hypothetical protein